MKISSRYLLLDLARGLAALEVCGNHLRRLLLLPYSELPHPTLFDTLLYGLTSLPHQAVVLFFVLSGFLVAGSVEQSFRQGTWSWTDYAARRLSRLWTVLLPCLLLTLFWDQCGIHLGGGHGYDGALKDVMMEGSNSNPPLTHSLSAFIGNALFLQTISVDTFGSNLALWSLANEFWYYVIFPLLFMVCVPGTKLLHRLIYLALALLILWWLPIEMVQGGLIWLMGYGAWKVLRSDSLSHILRHPLCAGAIAVGLLASLSALKRGGWLASDFTLGWLLSLFIPFLVAPRKPPAWLESFSLWLSNISYTLYLAHLPLLVFLLYGVLQKQRLAPGPSTYGLYAAFLLLTLLYTQGLWYLFERQSHKVLQGMRALIARCSKLCD